MPQGSQSNAAVCYPIQMRTSLSFSRASTAAALLLTVIGCSPSHQDASTGTLVSVNQPREEFKLYSPSSLVEVQKFADLPDGLRAVLLRGKYTNGGEGPDGKCCAILIAGVSKTSALVAYELFGYVPSYRACAFVQTNTGWVPAGEWNIGPQSTLVGLKEMTSRPPDFW
jgi:hypothetical protein